MSTSASTSACRIREELPIDEDLTTLADKQKTIFAKSLDSPAFRAKVRDYCKSAIERDSNLGYAYRFLGGKFQLEEDLLRALKLDAFAAVDDNDIYRCAVPDLKLIRRIALQRYAFSLARDVNRRLGDLGESRWWLGKDLALPRIPLAMPVGYGLVLGTPAEWIWALRDQPLLVTAVALVTCSLAWFLIYTNVRDAVGGVTPAGKRSFKAFGIGLVWTALFTAGGFGVASLVPELRQAFNWPSAIMISLAAYAIAVLVQFFFARSGSIADPL